jgi:hypothetical protein
VEDGCQFVRLGKSSHEVWHSPLTSKNFVVLIDTPSRHTANAILRKAGLPKALLERFKVFWNRRHHPFRHSGEGRNPAIFQRVEQDPGLRRGDGFGGDNGSV